MSQKIQLSTTGMNNVGYGLFQRILSAFGGSKKVKIPGFLWVLVSPFPVEGLSFLPTFNTGYFIKVNVAGRMMTDT